MSKERILIQGSSWTVGAYVADPANHTDRLVPGGLAELLVADFDVTNISVQDDFNLGSCVRLVDHLQHNSYDKILICQNDALKDLAILRNTDVAWQKQFGWSIEELADKNINSIGKLIDFLLDKFYSHLGKISTPVYVFAGPSEVVPELAAGYNLNLIEPGWTRGIVPNAPYSLIYSGLELDYALQLLMRLFPTQAQSLKEEFIVYADTISRVLTTWKKHKELFALEHPTALGNSLYYKIIKETL